VKHTLIILANSRKLTHRCIAGIDITTGKWVRPVSDQHDKVITWEMRNVNGQEPELLDILSIPLLSTKLDDESQPENQLLGTGKWIRLGKAKPEDVRKYLERSGPIFYNMSDRVSWDEIQKRARDGRKSLVLIECTNLKSYRTTSSRGKAQARSRFSFDRTTYDLAITDYDVEQRVLRDEEISPKCLLTISLAGKLSNTHPYCYKLVAGVIEL